MQEEYFFQKTLLYVGDEGEVSLDVIVDKEGETFWATQKTMAEVFKVLVIKNIKIDKIQYYFTMDLAQNEEKLEKSFYNFVEENGKYKFNNPEIKILD